MIKYINFVKEKEEYRKNQNSPTHKIVLVHTNGDKQYIGASVHRGILKKKDLAVYHYQKE